MNRGLKIKTKIILFSGFLAAVFALLLFFSWILVGKLENFFIILDRETEESRLVSNLVFQLSQIKMPPNDYLILGGAEDEGENFKKQVKETDELWAEVKAEVKDNPRELSAYENSYAYYDEFKNKSLKLFLIPRDEARNSLEAGKLSEELDLAGDRSIIEIGKLQEYVSNEVEEAKLDFSNVRNGIIKSGIVIISFLLLVLLVTVSLFTNSITKPIAKLVEATKVIAGGKFKKMVDIERNDELGELAAYFNKMVEEIEKSRREVFRKVDEQTKDLSEQKLKLENQQKAIMNILEDVGDEKNIAESERDRVSTILKSIGDGVFVVDKDLNIMILNGAVQKISGFTEEEAIGKRYDKVLKFVYERDEKINDQFVVDSIATGEVKEMVNHTLLITKDGSKIPVSDSAAPLKDKDGKVIGCVVVFRDVSRERDIDRAKTEFVSLASHQLRTPLSAINWYAEMLIAGDAGKLNKDQKKYIEEIYAGNQRMVELVNSLLNVSRMELGTFSIEPVLTDFQAISRSVLDELKPMIKKKKINLKESYAGALKNIKADGKLMRMIIQNLLSNSVKYTPAGGEVNIGIERVKTKEKFMKKPVNEDSVAITVKDTGYGIPLNQQEKIFSKLFRADNVRVKDTEGTGLGLYLVKSIVENSGGKIWFDSYLNKGTSFYVILPLSGLVKKKEGSKSLA